MRPQLRVRPTMRILASYRPGAVSFNLPFGEPNGFGTLTAIGMPIRRVTRILFSLCSDLQTDVIGESVQRRFDADIKLIERGQLLLW